MKNEILTQAAPLPIGPYSQGVEENKTMYISGQLPIDMKTGQLGVNIEEQATNCLNNLASILKENGATMNHIVKTTIFMTNLEDFNQVNDIYGSYFSAPYPSRSTVQVASLPKGAQIEIEVIAVIA